MNYFMLSRFLFIILSLACIYLIYQGLLRGLKNFEESERKKIKLRFILSVTIWGIALSGLSISGFLSDFSNFPPRMFIVLVLPLVVVVFLSFSKTLSSIVSGIPPEWFIYIQSFRIIVEILLWLLFLDDLLPVQMTFEGRNWDVLVGITGPIVGYFCFSRSNYRQGLVIVWNIFGLLLLLNILVIAVLSMPSPIRIFTNEPANIIVARFPFVLLPGILVPIAYSMHIFSLKQLLVFRKQGKLAKKN